MVLLEVILGSQWGHDWGQNPDRKPSGFWVERAVLPKQSSWRKLASQQLAELKKFVTLFGPGQA